MAKPRHTKPPRKPKARHMGRTLAFRPYVESDVAERLASLAAILTVARGERVTVADVLREVVQRHLGDFEIAATLTLNAEEE